MIYATIIAWAAVGAVGVAYVWRERLMLVFIAWLFADGTEPDDYWLAELRARTPHRRDDRPDEHAHTLGIGSESFLHGVADK